MSDYHVGCGLFAIYAGTLNKKRNMWINKSEVTDEVLGSAAQYMIEHQTEFRFKYRDKKYVMRILEQEDE